MDKRAETFHDGGNIERFVGPTPIKRASRIGFSGFRDVGGEQPVDRGKRGGRGTVGVDSGAGPYARSVLKGLQTDKTAIVAKQEDRIGDR
jgi:hypothetical protein